MANIKQYRSNAKIPGLPDTTNITDPQLRLFLDRLKLVVTNLTVTVDGLAKYNNVDNIVRDLTNSQYFNSIIDQKVTDISTGIVKSEVKKNNNKKNKIVELDAIEIDPVEMTLNVFNAETAFGTAEVYYVPHDTSPMYKGVTWSVSDDTVATIDQNGNVTALAVGKCTITATSNYDDDITAEAFLEVVYADTITVTATYQWCSQNSNVVCFTEIQEPVDGNCIWGATENTVTLLPDKTEEEAKAASALTTIATADIRKWISTRYPEWAGGKRFWRDEEKDTEPGSGGWKRHIVYGAWASTSLRDEVFSKHQSGIAFFCTTPPPDEQGTETTVNEVYGWAGAPNDYANLEYATNNQRKDAPLMDGEFKWHRDGGDDWEWPDDRFVHVLDYNRGYTDGYTTIKRVLNRTGNTVIVPEGSRHSGKWFEYVTTPIDGYPQITVWLQYEYIGSGFPTNNWAFINTTPNSDGTGWVDDAIIGGETAWLEHNGWRYVYDYYGLLFDLLSYHAWTLSPCHQTGVSDEQITVYTDPQTLPEDVTTGDEETGTYPTDVYIRYNQDYEGDGVIDEVYWWPEGQVTATGEGTYSITGNNGGTYYRH